jgi:hypothetical protein
MAAPLGFKTFNTGDVLSAADTNGYLMQGIWVFANATARDAAVTSPQEGNSCYLKDTDVIQVYSGSSWVVKSGGSSPLTTKGDLYTYSTTDARLPVGANGTTLVADSSTSTGLKWDTPAGASGPAFFVSKTGNQSISQNTWTKATMTVEEFDTDNCFASSTFTPNKAGYYQVSSTVNTQQASGTARQKAFYKNGAIFNLWQTSDDSSPTEVDNGSTLFYMNGTTDYLEVYVLLTSSTTRTIGSDDKGTMFCGVWIRS